MAEKFTYAAWVAMELRDKELSADQDARAQYWSNSGKIAKYDEYREYCKLNKLQPDNPPEGYWESKEEPWHKPVGIAMGMTGILVWFIAGIIGGASGQSRY